MMIGAIDLAAGTLSAAGAGAGDNVASVTEHFIQRNWRGWLEVMKRVEKKGRGRQSK